MGRKANWTWDSGSAPELASILGDKRQRRLLSILRDRSDPLSLQELATRLASQGTGTAPSHVPEEDYESVRVDLRHRCLPKLEAVGWIEHHPEGVSTTESFPFEDEELALPDLADADDRVWETISALLAYPHRQQLLQTVADRHHPLTVEEIAAELAGETPGTPERSDVDSRLLSRLHHVDLPRLTSLGLIEYDPAERTVTRTGSLLTLVDRIDLGTRLTDALITE